MSKPSHSDSRREARSRRARRSRPSAASSSRAGSRRDRRSRPSSRNSPPSSARRTPAPCRTARRRCTSRLLAVGVGPGDEVITVSHSFIATANAVRYCGATPGLRRHRGRGLQHRSRPDRGGDHAAHQGDPVRAPDRHAVRSRPIVAIGKRHGIAVIEDAACAIGSEILWDGEWEKIGKPHGDIACFSFHPRKVITTGDGGMLTTANPEYDRKFRLWRQHAMSVSDTVRHGSRQVIFESYPEVGYNYRMTDLQAAIGREQLKRLPEIVATRRRARRALRRTPRQSARPPPPRGAGLGAHQLAELPGAPCRRAPTSSRSCRPCSTAASRRGAAS